MRIAILLFLNCFIIACNEKPAKDINSNTTKGKPIKEDLETRARRHAEARLGISPTEKYTLAIYKENLDDDESIDAVITLNRLNFAMNEAAKSRNPAKSAELGFMGNYNYIFYYDGGLDKISPETPIPSSPKAKLTISFAHIASDDYKDILVDYRILNASYRNFYMIIEHTPNLVFEWKVFEGINAEKKEAYHFVFDKGSLGSQKDILVMKALMKDPKKVDDIYTFEPEIIPTSEQLYRFFYYPKERKYMTKK